MWVLMKYAKAPQKCYLGGQSQWYSLEQACEPVRCTCWASPSASQAEFSPQACVAMASSEIQAGSGLDSQLIYLWTSFLNYKGLTLLTARFGSKYSYFIISEW
jgi:hypothetical protein